MSRLTEIVYPDGYTVGYSYGTGLDSDISGLTSLSDDTGTLETFAYLGLATVVQEGFAEAAMVMTEISQTGSTGDAGDRYPGLDRFGRAFAPGGARPNSDRIYDRIESV